METAKQPDSAWWRSFRSKLLKWYDTAHRPLPWRETKDPYRIWISEIMLQQTQVATVLDYYRRFLEKFPTIDTLAAAEEEEVLAMWSGLGYYRRARQLHAAAKHVCQELSGQFPKSLDGVQALPGIGRYTAGAITSFAYDAPSPILEANTVRLFSRMSLLRDPTTTSASQKKLWEFAESLVTDTSQSPAQLNQAVMELGSQVCQPVRPACDRCPVAKHCPSLHHGLQDQIPAAKPKKEYVEQSHILVLVRKGKRVLVRQNQPGQWWEGLWDFPRTKLEKKITQKKQVSKPNSELRRKYAKALTDTYDLSFEIDQWFHSLKHAVTKYKIDLHCYSARLTEDPTQWKDSGDWLWVLPAEMESMPITSSARKVLSRIQSP